MIENTIIRNKTKTMYSFFPKNKRLRLSKQNLKYLSKERLLDNSDQSNINLGKNNISKKNKMNEKQNQANSYTKNSLNYIPQNNKWNYNFNFNINSSKPKYNIGSSTSINFWKGQNNGNKFKLNNFIKKNSNNNSKKNNKMRANNFMNINRIKNDRGSSVEQKYALNSKLFEQFINQYEQKIKKALFDIGINPDVKYNETNRDYFRNEYDGNFNNLPFLNTNSNNNEQKKGLNNLKTKTNKIISSYNLNVDNLNYLELKTSTNENSNNINNNNNNLTNSINSINGNNNIIFQNSFKNNYTNNIDNYSCNTNVNTKSHTINSINSAKGKETKKIISGDSTGTENNINNNLITIDKININDINNEKKEKVKKQRAMSTNPYTVKTTIDGNLNNNNKDRNNNLEYKNYHYYNSSNTSLYFNSKNIENDLSNYEIGHTLGKGAYAIVKVCTNKITKEKFAVKIYEKSKLNDRSKKKCVYREIEILKRINHKNIAKLYDVINTDKQILILQELVNGISLRDYYNNEIRNQKGISEHKSKIFKKIFKQIFDAMNYIHKRNIAHRDIKLENILMTKNYEIKIIDFGFGMYNPQNKLQNFFCGTPNYMPPEIAFKKPYNGQKADLWSLGVLVYKMFCADFPFKGKNEKDLYKAIERGKFKMAAYTPDYARKIILGMIELNPNKRMTCESVLKSEWLRE